MNVIGVDMGGTNIRASIINEKMEIIDEIHGKTPISAPSILKELIELVNLLLLRNSVTIKAIGVGASGIIHPKTGEVVGAGDTIPGWLGTKLKEHLGEHLPFPVFVGNDVNVAALGEGWLTGAKNFAFVSIGTGLGGAIVHDGSVITGDKGGLVNSVILYCIQMVLYVDVVKRGVQKNMYLELQLGYEQCRLSLAGIAFD